MDKEVEFSRRDFLSACSVLAASLAACSGAATRTRVAAAFLVDPALDDYRPALRALIETILPLPDFPMDAATVERRLLRMFPLEEERRFLGFQRTLVYFDRLDLQPHVAAPLLAVERIALDVPHRVSESEFRLMVAEKTRLESERCDAFTGRHNATTFAALPPAARSEWIDLWLQSEFTVKREFARGARTLILTSAYSADATWPAIGYDGPLVKRPERG